MSIQAIHRTVEFKLNLSHKQEHQLVSWFSAACWIYNQALNHRIKTFKRHSKSVTVYDQNKLLTIWRNRITRIKLLPSLFARDALRRVDRGFKAFFRRCESGETPGFPRFKSSWYHYGSLESLSPSMHLRFNQIFIPKLGLIGCRGINQDTTGKQLLLRIIRRASGWYAQIVFERKIAVANVTSWKDIGIDLGLNSFAVLSNGEHIDNPRFSRKSEPKLKRLQRRASKKRKGSNNRRKAYKKVAQHHERIASQRRNFAHQESRKLVNRYRMIAHEDLNIKGLCRTRMSKSITDAAWGMFIRFIVYKAVCAGKRTVAVDPRGTSQECPSCGTIRKKTLSERVHCCSICGLILDRDHAAANVILSRGRSSGRVKPVEEPTSTIPPSRDGKPIQRNRKS